MDNISLDLTPAYSKPCMHANSMPDILIQLARLGYNKQRLQQLSFNCRQLFIHTHVSSILSNVGTNVLEIL